MTDGRFGLHPGTWPHPVADFDTAGYWEAAREHRFVIQQCSRCSAHVHYPRASCPRCWSEELGWDALSGRATLYSFIVVHQTFVPGFEDDLPYVVGVVSPVEDDTVRIPTLVVDCPREAVHVGMPLSIAFLDLPRCTLPVFRPET